MTSKLNSSLKHQSQFIDPNDVWFTIQLTIMGHSIHAQVLCGDDRHSLIDRLCKAYHIPKQLKDTLYEKITQRLTNIIKKDQVQPALLDKVLDFFRRGAPEDLQKDVEEDTPMKLIEWRSQQKEEIDEPNVMNLFEQKMPKPTGQRITATSYDITQMRKDAPEPTRARTGLPSYKTGIPSSAANTSIHHSSTIEPTLSYQPKVRDNRQNDYLTRQINRYRESNYNISRPSERALESQRALREQQTNVRSSLICKNNRKSVHDSTIGQLKPNNLRKHTEPVNYRSSRTARGLTYHSRPEPSTNLCLMSRPTVSRQLEDEGRITRNKSTEKYLNKSMDKYTTGPTLRNSHSSVGVMKRFRYLADNDYGHTSYCA